MAEQDIPAAPWWLITRQGWTLIFDAMIGACLRRLGQQGLARLFHQDLLNIGFRTYS